MPLTKLLPWILAAMAASIAGMVSGISAGLPGFSMVAAAMFALALVATAVDVNRPWWSSDDPEHSPEARVSAAVSNAHLLVIAYFWGALSLLLIYRMTGLRWQHGLQYGAGMAAIGWLALAYVHILVRPASRLRSPTALMQATWLALAHGGAAVGGVLFLILSGKINSMKGDWAANQVFLAGGLAIAGLSVVSAYTQMRLARAPIVTSPEAERS
jgi:hypothetical protein